MHAAALAETLIETLEYQAGDSFVLLCQWHLDCFGFDPRDGDPQIGYFNLADLCIELVIAVAQDDGDPIPAAQLDQFVALAI